MSVGLAHAIVLFALSYVAAGALVSPIVILFFPARIDRRAAEASWRFRLIVLPGAILLWPLLLRRAIEGAGVPPAPRNAHRARTEGR